MTLAVPDTVLALPVAPVANVDLADAALADAVLPVGSHPSGKTLASSSLPPSLFLAFVTLEVALDVEFSL